MGKEWIEWSGGDQPESWDTDLEVRFRNGSCSRDVAGVWYWRHDGDDSDIVAYRILSA